MAQIIGQYQGVNITAGTDAQIQAQIAAINAAQTSTPTPTPAYTPPAPTPTAPTTPIMTADTLTPTPITTVAQATAAGTAAREKALAAGLDPISGKPLTPTTDYGAVTAGITPTIPAPTTQAQKEVEAGKAETTSLLERIKSLFTGTEGKATETQRMIEEAGISQQEKDIQELTNQLNSIQAESAAQQMTAEGQPIAMGFITGQQAQIQRTNAIKSLTVSSQIQAKQGNLTLALNQIDRAITLKYEGLETELKNKITQLELLDKYVLTPAENARKAELAAEYNYQQEQIKDQKAKDKIFESTLIDAMQGGMTNAGVSQVRNLYEAGQVDQANMMMAQYTGKTKITNVETYDSAKQEAIQWFEEDRMRNDDKKVSPDLYKAIRDKIPAAYRDNFDKWAVDRGYLSEETIRLHTTLGRVEAKPVSVAKSKVGFVVDGMKGDNESVEEISNYIKSEGYDINDDYFSKKLEGYQPKPKPKKKGFINWLTGGR